MSVMLYLDVKGTNDGCSDENIVKDLIDMIYKAFRWHWDGYAKIECGDSVVFNLTFPPKEKKK